MTVIREIIVKTRAQSLSPVVAEVYAILDGSAGAAQYRGPHYAISVSGGLPDAAIAQLRALAASKPRSVRLA